ncbi:MAG TPA: secretin N-terminal domain-containing protein [Phycisphaerae bacterium]|nr:secretin N-terminal domain-containing protein [Phycisphaerae bacterium]
MREPKARTRWHEGLSMWLVGGLLTAGLAAAGGLSAVGLASSAMAAEPQQQADAASSQPISATNSNDLSEKKRRALQSIGTEQASTQPAKPRVGEPASDEPSVDVERPQPPTTKPVVVPPQTRRPAGPPRVQPREPDGATVTAQAEQAAAATTRPADQAKAEAPTRPARPYNFNWDEREWADVLEDFSVISGLPLIGDDPPAGVVTFHNKRPMTFAEAQAMLNELLYHQNYHLLRFENYLLLKRLPEIIRIIPATAFYDNEEAFRAANRGDYEWVRIMYTPSRGTTSELIERARGVVPDYCLIGGIEGTNIMTITCMAGDARKFLDYVKKFERELPDPREQKIFKLEHVEAADVLPILQQLVDFGGAAPAPRGRRTKAPAPGTDEADEVTVAVAESNNWLIIKAPSEKMRKIEDLIALLDVPEAEGDLGPHVYQLEYARAEELAPIISQIVGAQAPARRGRAPAKGAADKPTIVPEPRTNSLIVRAEKEELEEIESLIKQFDVADVEKTFQRVTLKYTDAEQVANTVNQLLSSGPQPRGRKGPVVEDVQVIPDPAGGAVLVLGDPDRVKEAVEMIAQLDQELDSDAFEHVVYLEGATPSALAKVLAPMFGAQPGRRAGKGSPVQFLPFDDSNVLLVVAPPSDWSRIEPLIKELDRRAVVSGPKVYTWAVEHGDADEIADSINRVLGGAGKRRGGLQVLSDERTNTVLAQCDEQDAERIEALVKMFDVAGAQTEPQLIELTNADPKELAGMLEPFFGSPGKRPKGAQPEVQIVPAGTGLLIQAPPGKFEKITEMIAKLDQPGLADEGEVKTYPLQRAQAEEVANTLRTMLQARAQEAGKGKGRRPEVQVNADARTNQVVVSAPGSLIAFADDLIAKLDADDAPQGRVIRIVELQNADGNGLVKVVSQVMPSGGKGRAAGGLVVAADPDGKRMILTGFAEMVSQAEDLIKQLDAEAESTVTELKTFDLLNADAGEVAKQLQTLLADRIKPRGAGGPPPLKVAADTRTQTLLVEGTQPDVAEVERLLVILDKAVEPRPFNFVQVKSSDLTTIADTVRRMAEARWSKKDMPVIEADSWMGGLYVVGTEEQYEAVRKMVEQVDKAEPELPISRTIELTKATADPELLKILKDYAAAYGLEVAVNTVAEPALDRDESWRQAIRDKAVRYEASPTPRPCVMPMNLAPLLRQVDAMLGQTTQPAGSDEAAAPAEAPATVALDAVVSEPHAEQLDAPAKVSITLDQKGRLILTGPPRAVEDLAYFVDLIDKSTPEKSEEALDFEIYRLTHIDATTAAAMIDSMFNERVRPTPQPRQAQQRQTSQQRQQQSAEERRKQAEAQRQQAQQQAQQRAAQQAASQRVRLLADPRNNWLFIRARAEDMDPVLKMVAMIDRPAEVKTELKIVRLEKLEATQVEQALKAILGLDGRRAPARRAGAGQPQTPADQLQEQMLQLEGAEGLLTEASIGSADLIKIASDPVVNALMIKAPEGPMNLILGLIHQLEEKAPLPTEIRKFELANARAEEVVPQLESIFGQQRGRARGKGAEAAGGTLLEIGEVTFAADTRTNTVIARGVPKDLDVADGLIKELDREGDTTELELFPLENADATSMVKALQDVYLGQTTGRRGRGGAAPSDIRITADVGTNTVLVRAPTSLREQIGRDIRAMDQQSPRVFEQIAVQHADAESLAEMLREMFGGGVSRRGGRRGASMAGQEVQITGNSAAKLILVRAAQDTAEQIRQMVTALDVPEAGAMAFRVFSLKHAVASEILTKMQQMVQQLMAAARRSRSSVDLGVFAASADDRTNSLVVAGPPETFLLVEQVLQKLDVPEAAPPERKAHAVQLTNSDARDVARAISGLYSSQRGRRGSDEPPPRAEFNQATNTLLVYATDEEFEEINEKVIKKLEEGQGGENTEVVKLANAQAADLANILNQTLNQTARTGKRPVVVANEQDNSLVISATAERLASIKELIGVLDVAPDEGKKRIIKPIKLQYADPAGMADAINRAFRPPDRRPKPEDIVTASGEWGTNSVLVSATEEKFAEILKLVEEIDKAGAGTRVRKVINVINADAEDVAQSLMSIFIWQDRRAQRGRASVQIQHLRGTDKILIAGSAEEIQEVEDVARTLDTVEADGQRGMRVMRLANLSPSEADEILCDYLRKGDRGNELIGDVRITQSPSMSALIVSGGDLQLEQIAALVEKIDQPFEDGGSAPRILPLANARASQMAQTLTRMFTEPAQKQSRGRAGGDELVPIIVADEASNTLIVRATAADFSRIRETTQQIDSQQEADSGAVHIVQVAEGVDVAQLAREIERVINTGEQYKARKNPGTVPSQVSIGVDERTGSLLVSGSPEQYTEVERLVRQLEELKPTGKLTLKIIDLKNIDSARVQQVLDQILEKQGSGRSTQRGSTPVRRQAPRQPRGRRGELPTDMLKSPSPVLGMRNNTMLASCLALAVLAQAPAEAVSAPTTQPSGSVTTPTTQPSEARATETQPVTVKEAQIEGEVDYALLDDRTVVLRGDEKDLAILEAIISQIDEAGPQQTIRLFSLKNAQAADMAPMLQSVYQKIQAARPYSRPEDTITIIAEPHSNSLLVSALEERFDEIDMLIKQLDAKPQLPPVTLKTFNLKHIQAEEAKATLESLLQKIRAKSKASTEQITIEADDRTNSLLITASEQDFAQIEKFINTIDVPPAFGTAEMVIISLTNADADAMAKVIDEMLKVAPAGGKAARSLAEQIRRLRLRAKTEDELADLPELDLEKPIKVIPEPGTNSLIVSSNADNLKAMEKVIELLDRVPIWHEVMVRIFMLEHADADELAKMLTDMFKQGQGLPSRPGGKARDGAVAKSLIGEAWAYNVSISADARTNALVVSGREEALALAETLVGKLDQPGIGVKFPIRLFELENADAQRIATVIQQMMDRRLEALKKLGQGTLERERVFIEADIRSNMLIVSAKDENYQEIVELAQKLDSAPNALIDQIRIINLEKTQANSLKPKIEALWQRRAALRKAGGGLPEDQPVIEADERSNSLVIAANIEDFQMIERLVTMLEAQPLAPIADIRLIPLENNDASVVAPMVKKLFDERVKMRLVPGAQPLPSDQIAVEFDQATNSLIVASSIENYEAIVALVSKVDVEVPIGGVMQFFTLQYADANRVAEIVTNLFKEGLWKPGSLGADTPISEARDKVVVQIDERTNTIIVSASKENYSIIEALIQQVDVEEDFLVGNLQLFTLKYADAIKMAALLEDLFDKMSSAKKSVVQTVELPMTIIPEPNTNTLLIAGSRDGLTRAANLIERFDRRAGAPTSEFRVYQLQQADAIRIQPVVENLFKERQPEGQKSAPFVVEADAGSNSLIVSASREDHDLVSSLVAMLDRPSSTSEQVRIFPLKKGKAADMRQILDDLYSKRKGTGQEQTLVLGVDERTNSLLASGGPGDLADVETVIQRLDTTEPVDKQTVRIFRLKQADAEKMAELLGQIMEGKAGGAAGGTSTEIQSVLVSFVDVDEGGQEQVHNLLRERVQIIPDIRINSLIVIAPSDSMSMLESLIKKLDGIDAELAEVRVFRLLNADAAETVKTLEKLFQVGSEAARGEGEEERRLVLGGALGGEGATVGGRAWLTFTEDTRTNSVIAAGSKEYLQLAEDLILRLDNEAIEERLTKVVELRNADAELVQSALSDFVDKEAERYSELGEEAALRKIEREVSVVAYEETNQLMLSVSPRYESQIMQLVNDLDQPPPQVMIQAMLAEVTLNDRMEMGFEFALQDLLFSSTARVGNNNMLESNNFDVVFGSDLGAAGTGLGGFSFTVTGEDMALLMRMLEAEGQLEVISAPRIMAMHKKEANITVGQEVPFVRNVNFTEGGQTQSSVEYEKVGVILKVTPQINPDGFVIMEVEPEISSITSSSVTISEGLQVPIFNERSASTTITVRDGESAVIGGLMTTSEDRAVNKVPILGDIPILGNLFRATTNQKSKTELLIVLTPRVVRTAEDLRALSVQERDKGHMPDTVLTSPLMEELRVTPQEEVSPPPEAEPAEQPQEPKPVRYEIPVPGTYGPSKAQIGAAVAAPEAQRISATDEFGRDYEYYLRQRR